MNARMPHNNYSDLEINKSRILSKCSTNFGRTQNHCYWKLEAQIFGKHSPTKVLSVEYELYCGWTNQSFSFWHCEFRNNSKISTEIQYSLHNYGKSQKTKNLSRNVLVSFWSDLEFLSRRNLYFELVVFLSNILDLFISRLSEHFQYGRPRIHDKSSWFSHNHPNKGSLRNHPKTFSVIYQHPSISSNENLYITFLEPEKLKKHGYKFVRQREVRKHTKLK